MKIPFNKPFILGNELDYIRKSVENRHISGDGYYTKRCHEFFEEKYGFKKVLLTTSCTDALEMTSILMNIEEGDEIIMPSYTFVSTANAFALRGAKIVFVDSQENHPNIDHKLIEPLITSKTKAIVVVHYGGSACEMDEIMALSEKHNIFVVEDAAQAIDSTYRGRPLGSIGHFATFSFHETKNIISGEGGMLVINDNAFIERAEIIREKGTDRSKFFRGEVDKYGWVDIGSSFLPADIVAAFLFGQLEKLDEIQSRRKEIWNRYYKSLEGLNKLGHFSIIPESYIQGNNGHLFYLRCKDQEERAALIAFLKSKEIQSVFHYLSLHSSPYFVEKHDGRVLPNADEYSTTLLRLPLYIDLSNDDVDLITQSITDFYG